MKAKIFLTILTITFTFSTACSFLSGAGGGSGGLHSIFADLETAIKNKDENLFKKHWDAQAYDEYNKNSAGLSGAELFEEGASDGWYPKPDFDKAISEGSVQIIPCQIWSWEKNKSLDEIYLAVAGSKIIGGGENLNKVKELAKKYGSGK